MTQVEKITPSKPIKELLHEYIDEMDEYQARLVASFLKTLFHLDD